MRDMEITRRDHSAVSGKHPGDRGILILIRPGENAMPVGFLQHGQGNDVGIPPFPVGASAGKREIEFLPE